MDEEQALMESLQIGKGEVESDEAFVNESQPVDEDVALFDSIRIGKGLPTSGQAQQTAMQEAKAKRDSLKPKTWFGEFTSAFGRGVDSLQELGYGFGAYASDVIGFDTGKNYFIKKTKEQEDEMEKNPASVDSFSEVDSFDKGMRYFLGQLGQGAPMIAESVASGMIGAAAGTALEPGVGTVVGGLSGLVGRQAVKGLLKKGIKEAEKAELRSLVNGTITKEALSEGTKALLKNETLAISKFYGATALIGANSVAIESSSIYTDLLQDPNITESDRKVAATVGGFIAAIPDTIVGSWIASKFFPGVKEVTKAQTDAASNFLVKFAKTYGKEILKVIPAESGQEFIQTIVEEAAKNWADPAKRDAIFTFNEKQKTSFVDAAFGGGILGLLGGGVSTIGEMRAHPNPAVRSRERDLDQKTEDLSEGLDVTEDDTRLSQLSEQRTALTTQLATETDAVKKKAITELLGQVTVEEGEVKKRAGFINEEAEAAKAPLTPRERAIEQVRALFVETSPTGKGYVEAKPEVKAAKKTEIETFVNEIAPEPEATEYRADLLKHLTNDNWLNLLSNEGIVITTEEKSGNKQVRGTNEFQVAFSDDGKIELIIPKFEKAKQSEETLATIDTILGHEVIHVADHIAIRAAYDADPALQKEHKSLSHYGREVDVQRNKVLTEWWESLSLKEQNRFPSFQRQLRKVYQPKMAGVASYDQMSGEIPRMMVELARTGKLTETTDALFALSREQGEPEKKGAISKFIQTWVKALADIHETLKRLLNFETAPAEIVHAFNEIQSVLDKYGVLVNEKATDNKPAAEKKKESIFGEPSLTKPSLTKPSLTSPSLTEKGLVGKSLVGKSLTTLTPSLTEKSFDKPMFPKKEKVKKEKAEPLPAQQAEAEQEPKREIPPLNQDTETFLKETAPPNSTPDWVAEVKDRLFAEAKRRGLVEEIERLSAQRLTAKQVLRSLKLTSEDLDLVYSVRSKLGIPSMDEKAEFEEWLKEYNSRELVNEDTSEGRAPQKAQSRQYSNYERQILTEEFLKNSTPEQKAMALISGAIRPVDNLNQESIVDLIDQTVSQLSTAPNVEELITIARKVRDAKENLTIDEIERYSLEKGEWSQRQAVAAGWMATFMDEPDYLLGYEWGMNIPLLQQQLGVELDVPALVNEGRAPSKAQSRIFPDSAIIEPDGSLKVVYHTSKVPFDAFDFSRLQKFFGAHFGTEKAAQDRARVTGNTNTEGYYLNITNPFVWPKGDMGFMSLYHIVETAFEAGAITQEDFEYFRDVLWKKRDDSFRHTAFANNAKMVSDYLMSKGVDGITYKNGVEDPGSTSYIAFAPQQILPIRMTKQGRAPQKAAFRFTPEERVQVERMATTAANQTRKVFSGFDSPTVMIKEVQGVPDLDSLSPTLLEYAVQPHEDSARRAQGIIDKVGLWGVIEELQKDTMGSGLNIQEDTHNEGLPNAILTAVYELAMRHLDHIKGQMEGNHKFSALSKDFVNENFHGLEVKYRAMLNSAGQAISFTGKIGQFWNAVKAKAAYLEPILNYATQIFGKNKAAQYLQGLSDDLNNLNALYMNGAINRPEMIAMLRKLHSLIHTEKYKEGVRKTIAMQAKAVKHIVRRASQRAAEHQALDEDPDAQVQKVIEALLKDMDGVPKESGSRSELDVFKQVVARMTIDVSRELGIMAPSTPKTAVTMEQKFVAILKNDTLYDNFVQQLTSEYVKEFGGENPSQAFLNNADLLKARLANRYTPGMLDSLVNEKMRQHDMRFSKIVREKYQKGKDVQKEVRAAIAEYMKEEGVDDEALIDALANDIDTSFEEQVQAAREKFFGSPKGIKDALEYYKQTIGDIAKEHLAIASRYDGNFANYLVKEYGIPNTPDMPLASQIAFVMQKQLNKILNGHTDKNGKVIPGEREKLIERWIKSTLVNEKDKKKLTDSTRRIVQLSNLGVMRKEDVYRALQDKFGLPPYDPDVAARLEELGDAVANMSDDRTREGMLKALALYIEGKKGITTKDLYIAGVYFSMLSGPSTQMVNIASNATSILGHIMVQAVQNPTRIPMMMRALVRAVTGVGWVELRESFFTGWGLGKAGQKFTARGNPLEHTAPVFVSKFKGDTTISAAAKKFDEGAAKFLHTLIRGVKGNYVGRTLSAVDIFFYKVAQEISYTAKIGESSFGTPEMWSSAMTQARNEVVSQGLNPDSNREDKRKMQVLAHTYFHEKRLDVKYDEDGEMTAESRERLARWQEAHSEALDVTFSGEPKGWLGAISRLAEKFTADKLIGKLIVPFTKVAANVTNHMLEWTPYGFARYAFDKEFRVEKLIDGKDSLTRDANIAIRAAGGTAMIIALLVMLADQDEDDPYFMVYSDGPRDANEKRQLRDRGWKPYSFKVGNTYYSYLYTPAGMGLAMVGRLMDDHHDGKDVNYASVGVAMFRLVLEQSFIAGISDIMRAADSPDPIKNFSRIFARTATTFFVPNFVKQLDKWADPSIQEADGFWQSFLREIPVVRSNQLKPYLNVFGEETKRTLGPFGLPGTERFFTVDAGTDPVFNFLGQKRIIVPGYSKASHLNKVKMTPDQFYDYVKKAGPEVKKGIAAELNRLKEMEREDAQERVEQIATEEKQKVRRQMERSLR